MSELQVKTMAEFMAEGKEADILFWVGSAGSFDDRAKKITKAFVQIMNKAGVNFGVLGTEESSSGDAAKRSGNEFLFQMQAMTNIEVMNAYNVKRIVTTCPHSYNTIKNEYPSLGGNYTVQHHAEFISTLITEGKLTITDDLNGKQIVYHDPCYLGRANGVYDDPRTLIRSLGVDVVEMKRSKSRSFCCGAGGGHAWIEETKGKKVNHLRTKQFLQTKSDVLGVSCPFCMQMFNEGISSLDNNDSEVKDLIEIVEENSRI